MGQYNPKLDSGIKVLDRAVAILSAVAAAPRSLAELCEATSLPRATAHRLANALEGHRLLIRTSHGKWAIGPQLTALASGAKDGLIDAALPLMDDLVTLTSESVQLYQLTGTSRICVAAKEPAYGLQNLVPVGTTLSLTAGSAAQIFLAFGPEELRQEILPHAAFDSNSLKEVRELGWAHSYGEREAGLASISAPVFDGAGKLTAALSISGLAERFARPEAETWGTHVAAAADALTEAFQ